MRRDAKFEAVPRKWFTVRSLKVRRKPGRAAVLGQRVRGRPVPKGMQELNQLHKCPGLRRNPWRWYEPAGPTGDFSLSLDGTTGATGDGSYRGSVLLVSF